ncbi:MAG: phosphoribosylanthranilate isomerase [Deltaproteobacteria bacterium]|nr:phosphoribosylanthranilate isomerase [Deltaproteobacteria bacterium]
MAGIIQIAAVMDQEEADVLVKSGVHQLGFPFGLSVHREDISENAAAAIIRSLMPLASAVLITYASEAEKILELCKRIGTTKVQLHGYISVEEILRLNSRAPDLTVIKSLIVKENNCAELENCVLSFSPYVDGFITDTYDPATGACGATGKTHNWDISRRLADISPKPVMLAGGLNPGNVHRAIVHVRPAGVDAHTGVEGPHGRKDPDLVRAFVREAAKAFTRILDPLNPGILQNH